MSRCVTAIFPNFAAVTHPQSTPEAKMTQRTIILVRIRSGGTLVGDETSRKGYVGHTEKKETIT